MDPPSSIPVRTSGIPRPTSRLPVLRSSGSQSQLRPASSTEKLAKKPSITSLSKPSRDPPLLQEKTSRTSLVRSTTPSTTLSNTSSSRASLSSAAKRGVPASTQAQASYSSSDAAFKKPISRPPSCQTRTKPQPIATTRDTSRDDVLGDLDGFRSASRASSRSGFRDDSEYVLETNTEPTNPQRRKARPSLSDRTIESLSSLPSSPAGKGRRRSSFFSADNSMLPPARPTSALSNGRRPMTSDGTPQVTPATPKRLGGSLSQRGSMTVPGKRSVSATTPSSISTISTPSKISSVSRPGSQIRKQPLSQMQNIQTMPKPRPLSNSKTMTARAPKSRPSLAGTFGQSISPPATAVPLTPSPDREALAATVTPTSSRRVSNSSAALREQIAKAKAARRSGVGAIATEAPSKPSNSSGALREQIAKAKEAARRAHATKQFGRDTPPREISAVTQNEFGIEPDPEEISQFDFGLDDPFNQRSKGSKSLLQKRIDSARADGRLNISAMSLTEFPDEVLNMYKYDPNDSIVAWGEVVDLTTILAADNEFASLPDRLFPDVDMESIIDSEEDGPQFGGVQSIDLHGNMLGHVPIGLRRLSQLSKLNLSRNQLPIEIMDTISQIPTLRHLKVAENNLSGDMPETLGSLNQLEVLELQGNKITSLPAEIRKLTRLRTLNISNNQFNALPPELFTSVPIVEFLAAKNTFSQPFFDIDTVPHLQSLDLSNNEMGSLCVSGTVLLPALKTIDVSSNRLTALPDISSWTSLTTLLAGENKLTSFPEGFLSLQQLRNADFTANDISKLDERIALMEGLENLTIAANPLRERKFFSMDTQDIKRDLLSRLDPGVVEAAQVEAETAAPAGSFSPESDWQLKPSGTLDLSFKNLTEVDNEALVSFAASNDIRQIQLQQNYLKTIPEVFSQLTHLTILDLSKNNVAEPLIGVLSLSELRELRLAGNKIQSLDSLMSLLSAPNLQHLDVSNNRISGPLPIIRDVFPKLLRFMAADNAISEVTAKALKGLKIVNLSNNEIPRLDPRIGLLSGTLTGLDVEGNTFRVPNYAILQKGTDAVLNWLRDKIPADADQTF
ncbi:L domain-like protein [Lojkania enalia]|uniref:L domain-like protein n=1 Tax=Lojkania enalia TaxID=147567 RepID=A0A9P4K9F5_9PLEO|nr:L domain-like protein [Didymosphaeria enalia]